MPDGSRPSFASGAADDHEAGSCYAPQQTSGDPIETAKSWMSRSSLEMTPREVRDHPGLCSESVPSGTRVYTTFLPNVPFTETVKAAISLLDQGMRPVPHLAARSISGKAELDRMVGELADVGVTELLVVAGSAATPRGSIVDSMQVLRSGVLERHGITRIGVAGHPEGNSEIGSEGLTVALREKNAFAAEHGFEMYVLTQFCFAAQPIIDWERQIRATGIRLPVHVGLPGLTSPARLVKFGLSCGVGPSLQVLRKRTGGVFKLAKTSTYYPDQTILQLATAARDDPESLIRGAHFFPFGATARTAQWARRIASGRFRIDDRRGRLIVTT